MQDTVKITEFPVNEISEKERIRASEKAYHQAEQSIKNERLLKSDEYPKEIIMRLEESNRIGTIRAETVQELVRCKDCKYHKMRIGDYLYFCNAHSDTEMPFRVEPDGFCNLGKKE